MLKLMMAILLMATPVLGADADLPQGQILFQPMLIYATSEVAHQGTGYIIEDAEGSVYGVTSIHFLDFESSGLFEALWLKLPGFEVACSFRNSYGRPLVKDVALDEDIKRDFIILPADPTCFAEYEKLELDERKNLKAGEVLWFPNKDYESDLGHTWVRAKVVEDTNDFIEIKLDHLVEIESQSGSPIFSAETGKVVGMVFGGEEADGTLVMWLCPARNILRFLDKERAPVSLLKSVH